MKQIPNQPGQFIELDSGICQFSRDNPLPMKTWVCPVCSYRNRPSDDIMMIRYGMCERCIVWWEDEIHINYENTFDQRVDKFLKYVQDKSSQE